MLRMMNVLKWCGRILLGVAVAAILCAVLLHLPGTWNPEATAWSRLPPDARWAVQIHDLRRLVDAAKRDAGAESLLKALRADRERLFRGALSLVLKTGPLLSVIAPNAGVIGASDFRPQKFFLIFQPTVWMRCLAFVSGWNDGEIHRRRDADGDGGTICFSLRDGWMIAAAQDETVRRVIDGWDGNNKPLGPCPTENGPHVFFAVRRGEPRQSQSRSPERAAPEPPPRFAFADPFAMLGKAGSGPAKAAPTEDGCAARVFAKPSGDGWRVWGEASADGSATAWDADEDLIRLADSLLGESQPVPGLPESIAAMASARLAPGARDALLSRLPPASSDRAPEAQRIALQFLREAWLENTGDLWVCLAGEPAARGGSAAAPLPYPKLPLFCLGWSLPAGSDPIRCADVFAGGLEQSLESLRAAAGSRVAQSLLKSIAVSRSGSGGVLTIPPVMVNAARPAWRFDAGGGWLATDAEGFPRGAAGVMTPASLPLPEEGHARAAAAWDFRNNGFLAALSGVIEDRLRNYSGGNPSGREKAYALFRSLAERFPRGSLSCDADMKNRRLTFRATVLKGTAK